MSECDKLELGISGYIHFCQGTMGLSAMSQDFKAPGSGIAKNICNKEKGNIMLGVR